MVIHSAGAMRIWEQSNNSSLHARFKGNLRHLEFTKNSVEVRLQYQKSLALALIDSQPGWEVTERAKHLRLLDYTTGAYRNWVSNEVGCEASEAAQNPPSSGDQAHPDLKKSRWALHNCAIKYK